jgi:hypothetical protein
MFSFSSYLSWPFPEPWKVELYEPILLKQDSTEVELGYSARFMIAKAAGGSTILSFLFSVQLKNMLTFLPLNLSLQWLNVHRASPVI